MRFFVAGNAPLLPRRLTRYGNDRVLPATINSDCLVEKIVPARIENTHVSHAKIPGPPMRFLIHWAIDFIFRLWTFDVGFLCVVRH